MSYTNGPTLYRENLICCFDAANKKSFSSGESGVIKNLANQSNNAQISNILHSYAGNNSFFDTSGYNVNMQMDSSIPMSISGFTYMMLFKPLQNTGLGWNYFYEQAGGGTHRYELGYFGAGAGFLFKDNADSTNTSFNLNCPSTWQLVCFGASLDGKSFGWNSAGTKRKYFSVGTGWNGGSNLNVTHFFRDSPNAGTAYFCQWNFLAVYNKELSNEEIEKNYYALRGRMGL